MTSQGTPHGRFSRAIRDRHFQRAIMAAYELEHVTLENALELTILAAEVGDRRWPKLAARWHSLFVDETRGIGAAESAFVLAAACALDGPLSELAAKTLRQLVVDPSHYARVPAKSV
jgi:hypothetical protein